MGCPSEFWCLMVLSFSLFLNELETIKGEAAHGQSLKKKVDLIQLDLFSQFY